MDSRETGTTEKRDNLNFETLSKQLTSEERKDLLEKMSDENIPPDNVIFDKDSVVRDIVLNEDDTKKSLIIQLNQESIFKRFFLWLKATFSNLSIETVYNQTLVKQIAKDIEYNNTGILNYRQKLFLNAFYEKLIELEKVHDFFTPYVTVCARNIGEFYIRNGDIIAESFHAQIKEDCDPYQISLKQKNGQEQRGQFLVRLEESLNAIAPAVRSQMYACARGFEWLRQFCAIDIKSMIEKFRPSERGFYDCMFSQLRPDFADFVKVLSCEVDFSNELFRAMLSVYQQATTGIDNSYEDADSFLKTVDLNVSFINVFRTIIPLKKISKVVFENSMYVPETLGGSENWFVLYKEQWRSNFNKRWNEWIKDSKKEDIKQKMFSYFELNNLPQLPVRPWTYLSGNLHHRYENIIGFIYYFMKNLYKDYNKVLNTLMIEGDFLIKENAAELTDIISRASEINEDLDVLSDAFKDDGDYGCVYNQYVGYAVITQDAMQKISEVESFSGESIKEIVSKFGELCRSVNSILSGVLGFSITNFYAGISNFHKIQGTDNKKYVEKLIDCYDMFKYAYEILLDLQTLECLEVK